MAGQAEYAFWHVLTRDVAYAQLPRAWRAARHAAAADWIEDLAGDRVEDFADVLAHHAGTALELALQTGDDLLADRVRPATARFQLLAGERAVRLDATEGFAHLGRAVALIPDGDPLRARALAAYGKAAFHTFHLGQVREALEQAVDLLLEAGDMSAAVDALFELGKFLRRRGDPHWYMPYESMLALVAALPLGPVHVPVYTYHAAFNTLRGMDSQPGASSLEHYQKAVDYADRALSLASDLGMGIPAEALGWRGQARVLMADLGGIHDIEDAITLATPTGQRSVGIMYIALARILRTSVGPLESRRVIEQGIAYADAHGLTEIGLMLRREVLWDLADLGETDELLTVTDQLAARRDVAGDQRTLMSVRWFRTYAMVLRGDARETVPWLEWLLAEGRIGDFRRMDDGDVGLAAVIYAALGDHDTSVAFFTAVSDTPGMGDPAWTRALVTLGELDLAERLVPMEAREAPVAEKKYVVVKAALAEARGEHAVALVGYVDATRGFRDAASRMEEAFALLGQGRCLLALHRTQEAFPVLQRARDMFATMGARPAHAEAETLLASLK